VKFDWDSKKSAQNREKHEVGFEKAKRAFYDKCRVIAPNVKHSAKEVRFFCFGMVDGMVLTARFTLRGEKIRIIGAGYWRKGRKCYEEKNKA
jgi:uncharacterized protein